MQHDLHNLGLGYMIITEYEAGFHALLMYCELTTCKILKTRNICKYKGTFIEYMYFGSFLLFGHREENFLRFDIVYFK